MTPLVSALVDAVVYLLRRACQDMRYGAHCRCEACELCERLKREAA